jgi:hypothetical protein
MKKIHKKIAHLQAARLDKLLKTIKSNKKGCKLPNGYGVRPAWYYNSRKERTEIMTNNGDHYRPELLKTAVTGYSNYKKAVLLRGVIKSEQDLFDKPRTRAGRQWRLWGGMYSVKDSICRKVFFHLIPLTKEEHEGLYGGSSEIDFA